MHRIDDLTMFAQLICMLDSTALRAHAARAYRCGWNEDLAVIRIEFRRRRALTRALGQRAA